MASILFRKDCFAIGVRMVKSDNFQIAAFDFAFHLIKEQGVDFEMSLDLFPCRLIGRFANVANSNGPVYFANQNSTTLLWVGFLGG